MLSFYMSSNVLGNTIFLIPLQFQNEFLQILLTSFRTRQSVSIEFKHPINSIDILDLLNNSYGEYQYIQHPLQ